MSRFAPIKKPVFKKAAPAQPSVFKKFEAKEVEVELDDEEVLNIVTRMMELGTETYFGFILLSKDKLTLEECADLQYNDETQEKYIKPLHDAHVYCKTFKNFFFRNLAKAAAQICSNIVYADDDGKAYTAMSGNAEINSDGFWIVSKVKKDKNVVPISSMHAVDLQLFVGSVDIGLTQTIALVKGVQQTISIPKIIPKNVLDGVRLELPVKKIFTGLLVLPDPAEDGTYTDEQLRVAPWKWKQVYTSVKDLAIPAIGIPLQLIYFALVRQTFSYSPYYLDWKDVFYQNYDYVNKDLIHQLSKYSVYRGGYFLNKFHFFNRALSQATGHLIGGFFPVKWTGYNTYSKMIWERDGASLEGGGLDTSIQTPRVPEEFDGIWYDPAKCVDRLVKAVGVIIPYDIAGNGLAILEKFIAARVLEQSLERFPGRLWASYGPCPCLWWEFGDGDDTGTYNRVAAEILWKTMGTMALYNYSCSLNLLAARDVQFSENKKLTIVLDEWKDAGVPYRPILAAVYTPSKGDEELETYTFVDDRGKERTLPVPSFAVLRMKVDELPGRHMIDNNINKQTSILEEKWGKFNEYARKTPKPKKASEHPPKAPKRAEGDAPMPPPEGPVPDEDVRMGH